MSNDIIENITPYPANKKNIGGTRAKGAIKYLVYHYTGNDGDTAKSNAKYYAEKVLEASAHYFVDDNSVYQSVPDLTVAWAVGGDKWSDCPKTGGGTMHGVVTNSNSISIEMCDTVRDGKIMATDATLENAVKLGKLLMERYSIPLENVYRHFDVTGKHCPAYFMDNVKWEAFKKRLVSETTDTTASTTTTTETTTTGGKTMRCVSGATAQEDKMIKAVQGAVGAIQDGSIGTQTMSDIACKLKADCFPLALTVYSNPLIIAKDCVPLSVKAPLSKYAMAISGSFNDGTEPCSILVSGGKVVHATSCHYWDDKTPESVIYRLKDGTFGYSRVLTVEELPSTMEWAVGGMGLCDHYDPAREGFKGKFSDVLRKTNHTMLGVKNGYVYMVYVSNMTATQVNHHAQKLGLQYAIMLDGGHLAAINSDQKINTGTTQFYVIQAV